MYYDQPDSKERVTRKGPSVDYKDPSSSQVYDSLVQIDPKPPSKTPVSKQPLGKTAKARNITSQFQIPDRLQAVPDQTTSGAMKPSRVQQSTEASRQRAVRTTSGGDGSSRPTTRSAVNTEQSPLEVKRPRGNKTQHAEGSKTKNAQSDKGKGGRRKRRRAVPIGDAASEQVFMYCTLLFAALGFGASISGLYHDGYL
ncbi:hypothetical protein K438DRAFT_1782835 [Mycena galopus ATCC 62051]|nr:hypothetical protein K438DRAFT_1782835 [Mycena galopus ATCC 62051]